MKPPEKRTATDWKKAMLTEKARQCLSGMGFDAEHTQRVTALLEENRRDEARQKLRQLRCGLMDELHSCQRKVNQLDWLIRETEKDPTADRR